MNYILQLQRKEQAVKYIKIVLGGVLGLLMASGLGLSNAITAGIIAILSLQSTKKETLVLALRRLIGLLIAFGIAWLCFWGLGYTVLAYIVFLTLFAFVSLLLGILESVTIHAVLIGQILAAGNMSLAVVGNQSLLFVIGAGLGILLNLFIITRAKDIHQIQETIDNGIREVIYDQAEFLRGRVSAKQIAETLEEIISTTESAIEHAKMLEANFLLNDYSYYTEYLVFRRSQLALLGNFEKYQPHRITQQEENRLADFLSLVGDLFHECSDGSELLRKGRLLLEEFRKHELPATRTEFEQRAALYTLLNDTLHLIQLKQSFVSSLTVEQMSQFYIYCEVPS